MGEHYFGVTDTGRVRDNNEDAFLAEEAAGGGAVIACVIDGVGGYEGGEVAAATAREAIHEHLSSSTASDPEPLREAVLLANTRIIEEKKAHRGGDRMACVLTLALADLSTNQFHYAHVGDTRMYLLRGSSLVKVTKDHSFVGFLEDSSRITEQDAMRHPKRNEINKALGFDPNIGRLADYVEIGSSPFLPGDVLLLCSDGLTDMISSREITDILTGSGSIANKTKALVEAANEAGGRDNVTVVLVHNNKARAEQQPTAPVAKRNDAGGSAGPTVAAQTVALASAPPETTSRDKTTSTHTSTPSTSRKSSALTWLLALACIALAAALVWVLTRKATPASEEKLAAASSLPTAPTPKVERTPGEQQLRSGVSSPDAALLLDSATARAPIVLTDSILVKKESLHVDGAGAVLRGDGRMAVPAFVFSDSVRFVFLENLVFENFPVAIQAGVGVLQMANVRFIRCGTSVAFNLRASDSVPVGGYVNGATLFNPVASFTKGGSAR